ncbi:hypothetical protein BO71DRAFT_403806 [Aspergillus ellipticus CBS 707.79]|uniref:Uncharacterized protein n=1 Tax=Aspergillus ellipticus CBS 707.79 TaxID=1448320 RepID=A0A319DBR4_9EURO|nr:hypothetical protein BO71DRAFT_403806 [Aspergillus ellipticus CBS 707.79]
MNSTIVAAINHGGPGVIIKMRHKPKFSDDKTHGDLPLAECAPLKFAGLDELADHRGAIASSGWRA